MTDRDRQRLLGVHPQLVTALTAVLAEMNAAGTPMFVVCGVRTDAEQEALYAQGRTEPGKIVTYDDGVKVRSHHQRHSDGYGHAADLAFVPAVNGRQNPFDPTWPWEYYGERLEAHGVDWGGNWAMQDLPHAELAEGVGLKA